MAFCNIRVFFSKTGDAKYISHLDLYRAMGRAIKRAKLPVWITEGFNPHIYMTFALPLALGVESDEESMDLRLLGDNESCGKRELDDVCERLNAVMPSGLRIIRVEKPVKKATQIQKADYLLSSECSDTMTALAELFSRDEIMITKKTKRNIQQIDVKPLLEWNGDRNVLTLPAGTSFNITPWNVLEGFDLVSVKRMSILCDDGSVFV